MNRTDQEADNVAVDSLLNYETSSISIMSIFKKSTWPPSLSPRFNGGHIHVMSLFKKPKKNLSLKSSRVVDDDAELESETVELGTANPPKPQGNASDSTATAEKTPAQSKVSAVSFAEENEDVTGGLQIKKSDRSMRVVQQLKQEYAKTRQGEKPGDKGKATKKKASGGAKNNDDVILVGEEAESHEDNNADAPVSIAESLQDMMKTGQIPDANLIHIIRQKRQLMRDTGIATGTVGNVGVPVKVEPRREDKSALVREDDEADRSDLSDQEAADDDGRLKMSVRQRNEDKRQQLRNTFLNAEQGSDPESDHEREWERQQISKGVSTMTVADRLMGALGDSAPGYQQSTRSNQSSKKAPVKVSLGEVRAELSQHLSDLVESHRRHKFERQARADSYEYSQEEIKKAEERTSTLDHKYCFYQELLAYVADLIDCYNTKMPGIISLEEKLMTVYRQRSDRLMKRRRQDVVDQSLESAPVKPGQAPFQPDEEMRARIAERTNRRSRRRWKRQEQGVRNHYDGWSTDDEECTSDHIKLGNERDAVRKQVAELLSEICDDFVQLDAITSKFDDWRKEAPDSYRAAFGGLCLAKVVAPLVRLNVLDWNPFEENATSIQDHTWFKSLAAYCQIVPPTSNEPVATLEDEISILPCLIDRVILPKINDFVAKAWDPLSLSQATRLADLVESLATTYPTLNASSKQVRDLVTSIKKRFGEVLDSDVFMPLCNKQGLSDRSSPLAQFFYRQLWTCVKLFVSMSRFSNIMSPAALQDIMLTGLLNRYVALGLTQLDTVTQEIVELYTMIMSAVPVIWFANIPATQTTTIDKLKPFATLLFQLVGRFAAVSTDPSSAAAVGMFASAVSDFFTTIHAYDLASRIVSELKIQLPR